MTANHHILRLINIFDLEMESDLKRKKNNEWNHWNIRRLKISTCVISTKAGLISTAKIVFVLLLIKKQIRNILHRIWVQINHILIYSKIFLIKIKYSKVIENRRLYFGESKDLQHDDGNNSSSILSPSLIITSPYLATTKIRFLEKLTYRAVLSTV